MPCYRHLEKNLGAVYTKTTFLSEYTGEKALRLHCRVRCSTYARPLDGSVTRVSSVTRFSPHNRSDFFSPDIMPGLCVSVDSRYPSDIIAELINFITPTSYLS